MDRLRDDRDPRGGRARGGYGRDGRPARFSRNSPPLSIPLRAGYPSNGSQSYQSIPLRPAGPQRYSDSASSSAYNSPGPYYRGDAPSQLPARPVQRYRSPPLAGSSTPTSRPGWDTSRGRDARGGSGWARDDYRGDSGNSGPPSRGGGWRESDRDAWDRDRDRRSQSIGRTFSQDGGGRGGAFEVPYRQAGVDTRKRSRDSSEEDDRDDEQYPAGRGRGVSTEWRGRPALGGARDSFDRGYRTVSESKVYPVVPGRAADGRDERTRRPTSPTGSDNVYDATAVSRRPSEIGSRRNSPRRARSYSPGEISEGPRRSYSPASRSRSRSRSPPPSRDGRPTMSDVSRMSMDNRGRPVESLEARLRLDEGARGRPLSNGRSTSPRTSDGSLSLSSKRPPSPRRMSLSPRRPSPRRATSPVQRRPASDAGGSTPPRPLSFRSTAPPPPLPVAERIARRSSTPPRPAVLPEVAAAPKASTLPFVPYPQPLPTVVPPHRQYPSFPLSINAEASKSTHLRQYSSSSNSPNQQLCFIPPTVDMRPSPPAPVLPETPPLPAAPEMQAPRPTTPLEPLPPAPAVVPASPVVEAAPVVVVEIVAMEEDTPEEREFRPFDKMDLGTEPAAEVPLVKSPSPRLRSLSPRPRSLSPRPRSFSPRPRSPSPVPALPMDFGSILGGIIAANERDSGDVNDVMESNRARTEKERSSADVIRDLTNRECFSVALEAHKVIEPFLCAAFARRDQGRGEQMVELRGQYKARNDDWQAHCRRLDRIKDRIHRRRQATTTAPVTPSIDPSGLPFFPEPMTPGPSIVGRGNRRNPSTAFGYGDAVRSEAEFLEILASLETADMRDPNVRATRTAAIVPDMVLDETERRNILSFEDDRRLVEDPVAFYSLRAPLDLWTEDEVQIFCKRFSQHPKQFGRIAAELSEKSTAQCVLFYYRMKTTIDFRSLSDRRSRDGRRRKPRRRTDGEGHAKKGASLMSNLKRARADEQEDEDDSPPPSPQMGRRTLVGESPSVFQPRESNSRPAQSTQDAAMIADLGSRSSDKKARTPKLRDAGQLGPPPSDGMLEAAEVLGALAGIGSHEADDGDGRKRDAETDTKSAAARRKSTSSSYWSVAERNEFIRLLGVYGKDWNRLAEGLENKTAVQCRNWFQNHAKKLNLAEVAKNADTPFEDEDDDENAGSGTATPRDFSVPLGVPLSESLGQAAAIPRAGFFVGDSRARSTNLPSYGTATLEGPPKAGIRSILNDDVVSEKAPPAARADWFGGDNGAEHAGGGESAATTEDESDAPKPRTGHHPRSDSFGGGAYPAYASDSRYPPGAAYDAAGYSAPSSSHYSPYAAPTHRSYPSSSRQPPESNGHWQASPASSYAAYGSAPKPSTEFYRRSDQQEPRQHFGGQVARQDHNFPPQKPTPASFDRPSPSVAFPHDTNRAPPPPPSSASTRTSWPPAR